ncbi:hypothetical protein BGZ52_009097, partial [Haplosporangium bisporale]
AVPRVVKLWRESLIAANRSKTAESLADPTEYEDMFPDLQYGLMAEEAVEANKSSTVPASAYFQWKEQISRDVISDMKSGRGIPDLAHEQHYHHQATADLLNLDDGYSESRFNDTLSNLSLEVNTTGTGSAMDETFEEYDDAPAVDGEPFDDLI